MKLLFTQKKPYALTIKLLKALMVVIMVLVSLSTSYAQHPRERVYANTVQKSPDEYLALGLVKAGYVNNQNSAIDGNVSNYATLNSTVVDLSVLLLKLTIGGEAWINLKFDGDKPTPQTPVTVKLGLGNNLLSVLSGLQVQATKDGVPVGNEISGTNLLTVLKGDQVIEFTFIPQVDYDGVRVKLGVPKNSLLSIGALATAKVYHAYFTKQASDIVCETPIDVLFGNTGILAGGLNAVEFPERSIDRNPSTAALLRANVGALNQTYLTAIYPALSRSGDSIRLILRNQNTGLLDLSLLSQNLKIRTYNDNQNAEDLTLNSSLLKLNLLGGSSNLQVLTFPTSIPFNRIQVSIGDGVAMALGGLYVHEIGRVAPSPIVQSPGLNNGSLTVCEGIPVNLGIASPESGSTYRWFDASNNEITTGTTNNGGNLNLTGLSPGTHELQVALYRFGCSDPISERAKITIIVTPGASAADINASNTEVCFGSPVLLAAPSLTTGSAISNPVFKWYFDVNKTQAITDGIVSNGATYKLNSNGSLSITGLTASRNYYISVSGTGTCENPAGALKQVTATINNVSQPVIDLAGNQTIGAQGSITFTASATGAISYQWFKNNNLIPGATNSTYTINNASSNDAGAYTVIAYGLGGCSSIASTAVNLQVGGFGSTKTVEGLNANGKIEAGSNLTYKITVSNPGSSDLTSLTITDPLPQGTAFVSANNGGTISNNTVQWDNLTVPANGSLTVSMVVKVADDLTTIASIGNKATVTVPGQPDQNPEIPPVNTEQIFKYSAQKTVDNLNASNQIEAGSLITYSIQVKNEGSMKLSGISVKDIVPNGTTYQANSADNGGLENGGEISWLIDLNVGETKTVSFKAIVSNNLTNLPSIENVAKIEGPNGTVEAKVGPTPTNQIRKFVSEKFDNTVDPVQAGDEITYTIKLENQGNIAISNISITDPIPTGTTYIANSASHNGILSSNTLEWDNLSIPVGGTTMITFKVRVKDDLTGVAVIKNKATVNDPEDPQNPQNPETPGTNTQQIISYAATKTLTSGLNSSQKIEPGAELTYVIAVENKGNVLLDNVSIEDLVPNGTTYIAGSASHSGAYDNISNTLTWNVNIPVGTTLNTEFKVKVNNDLSGIASIKNTATVKDDTNPTNPTESNPKTVSTPYYDTEQNASFQVTSSISSSSGATATPGAELTITINVENTGNVELSNISIENPLPAYTSYLSGGNFDPNTGKITLDIPAIAVGATESVTFKVKVDNNVGLIKNISNYAIVTANSVSKTAYAEISVSCPQTAQVASISATGNTICLNNSSSTTVTITADPALLNPVFYLYDGNNLLVASNTTGIFTVNATAGQTYTYYGGVSADGYCETIVVDRKKATFSVSNLPGNPSVTSTNVEVCPSTKATLMISNPENGITYNWYNQSIGGILLGSGTSYETPAVTANTTFYVEATNASSCTSAGRTAVNVNLLPAPAAPASVNIINTQLCSGSPAKLSVDNPVSGLIYRWYSSLSGGSYLYEGDIITTSNLTGNTTLYVEAVNTNSCVSATRTKVDITVLSIPVAPAAVDIVNGPSICSGSIASLTIKNPISGISYRWYTTEVNGTSIYEGTSYATGALTSDLTLFVEAVNSNSCVSADRTKVTIKVIDKPSAPASVSIDNKTICVGTSATLSVDNPVAGTTYNWYSSETGGSPLHTGQTYPMQNLQTSTTVFVEAMNANLCISSTRTRVNITVLPIPATPVSAKATSSLICSGATASLYVESPIAGITYKWYTSLTGGAALGEGDRFTTAPLTTNAVFYVEAVNANSCVSSGRAMVNIDVIPVLAVPSVSVQNKTTNSITFSWSPVANANGYEISINNGQTWSSPSSGATGTTHTFNNLKPAQQISISVRAMGSTECQTSAGSALLTVESENPLGNGVFIPNTFTPNNDGQNDYFMVYGNTINSMIMRVFNQWGQMIFQSNQPTVGWDGNYQGKAQPSGVYVYQVEVTFNDGSRDSKKGTVTLIR